MRLASIVRDGRVHAAVVTDDGVAAMADIALISTGTPGAIAATGEDAAEAVIPGVGHLNTTVTAEV
ncbi:hypothetical protein [Nocardia sp. NPDC005998]|uniref:hypothetical protein n=1 Tax=Nocardia sp. NPDC005998 TaxID=3156894 RepID=UPI0033B8BC27